MSAQNTISTHSVGGGGGGVWGSSFVPVPASWFRQLCTMCGDLKGKAHMCILTIYCPIWYGAKAFADNSM